MKSKFKSIFMTARTRALFALLSAACLCTIAGPSQAQIYFTVSQLLAEQFRTSDRVSYRKVAVTDGLRSQFSRDMGVKLAKNKYTVYVATTAGKVDGYALFDEERGQHEMIGFATFFDSSGKVTRVEITAFREPHGDGVRAAQFRKQFVGRTAHSGFLPDADIDAVSGATISSRSLCKGVKRAAALLDVAVIRDSALARR